MQQFSNQEIADLKSRIDEIHELLAARGGDESAVPVRVELEPSGDVAAPRLVDQLSFSIQARRMRRHHFGSAQMSVSTQPVDLCHQATEGMMRTPQPVCASKHQHVVQRLSGAERNFSRAPTVF